MEKIDTDKFSNIPEIDKSKYDVYIANLSEFPYEDFSNHVEGKNGPIDFYHAKEGVKVLAFNEVNKNLKWSEVRYWSVHKDRKLEIVTLDNGYQIFTDNDERAIYGLDPFTHKFIRSTPTKAKEMDLLIPCFDMIKDKSSDYNIEDFAFPIETKRLKSALETQKDFYDINIKTVISYNKEKNNYFLLPFTKETKSNSFAKIINIEYTEKLETGYDLTVPGYETFTNLNGIVLSNTINIHVPGLPDAVDDVKKKLMPSKQIFSPKTNDPDNLEVVNKLKQDLVSALYSKNVQPAEKSWLFKTEKEALDAIKSGKVKLSDDVTIIEK